MLLKPRMYVQIQIKYFCTILFGNISPRHFYWPYNFIELNERIENRLFVLKKKTKHFLKLCVKLFSS